MSPLSLRYANVGSFSNFSLSIYDKSLIPGSSFVALLWTFSIAILYFMPLYVQMPVCHVDYSELDTTITCKTLTCVPSFKTTGTTKQPIMEAVTVTGS